MPERNWNLGAGQENQKTSTKYSLPESNPDGCALGDDSGKSKTVGQVCHEISLIFPPAQIGNEETLLIISRPKICSWTFIDSNNRNSPSSLCRVSLYFERFFMTSNDHRTCSCLKMVLFTAVLVTTQQSYIQVPSKYVPSRDFWNAKFLLIKSPSHAKRSFYHRIGPGLIFRVWTLYF